MGRKAYTPDLSGVWESNANVLTLDDPDACDELSGGLVLPGITLQSL